MSTFVILSRAAEPISFCIGSGSDVTIFKTPAPSSAPARFNIFESSNIPLLLCHGKL